MKKKSKILSTYFSYSKRQRDPLEVEICTKAMKKLAQEDPEEFKNPYLFLVTPSLSVIGNVSSKFMSIPKLLLSSTCISIKRASIRICCGGSSII